MSIYHLVMLLTSSLLSSPSCPLPAFFQLLPWAVSSADLLPAPTLSTDPSYDVYYQGENVALICSAPTKKKIDGFRFFNQTGDQIHQKAPFYFWSAKFHLTATKASSGDYTCLYFMEDSGQEVPSNRSLPLSIKVQAAPMAPTLSLAPQQKVYRPGDSIQLFCSIHTSPADVQEFHYYTNFGVTVTIPVVKVKNHSYNLKVKEISESYSCAYYVLQSQRCVLSERSSWVHVSVQSDQISWIREVVVGGSFFTINGLIFVFTHCLMKRRRDVQD